MGPALSQSVPSSGRVKRRLEKSDVNAPFAPHSDRGIPLLYALVYILICTPHQDRDALFADPQRPGWDPRRPRDLRPELPIFPLSLPAQPATVGLDRDEILLFHPLDQRPYLPLPQTHQAPDGPARPPPPRRSRVWP